MSCRIDLFTTNPNEGWIEVIKKEERKQKAGENSITITPTAWANIKSYMPTDIGNEKNKHYVIYHCETRRRVI